MLQRPYSASFIDVERVAESLYGCPDAGEKVVGAKSKRGVPDPAWKLKSEV